MKNSLGLGLVLGIIFPVVAFLLMKYTDLQMQLFSDKPTGLYVIAAAINIVGCYVCYKKGLEKLGNGLILITFLSMLLLVFTKNITI